MAAVSECAVPVDRADRTCRDDDPVTPAVEAGVREGDVLVSFNGVALTGWEQMGDLIRDNRDGEAVVVVENCG